MLRQDTFFELAHNYGFELLCMRLLISFLDSWVSVRFALCSGFGSLESGLYSAVLSETSHFGCMLYVRTIRPQNSLTCAHVQGIQELSTVSRGWHLFFGLCVCLCMFAGDRHQFETVKQRNLCILSHKAPTIRKHQDKSELLLQTNV